MSQIKTGAVISYTTVAFNAVAGLLYTPWMVECIGADDYALYTLAISVINFFLMDFGLSNAVTRFLSKCYAEGRRQRADELLGLLYKLYFALTAAMGFFLVAVYFNIDIIYASLPPDQMTTFKGLYLIVAGYSIVTFPCMVFGGVLSANERFVALNLCNLLQKVFAVGLIVAALIGGFGVFALVAANAVTSLIFSAAKYVLIRCGTSTKARLRYWDKAALSEIVGFSGWVSVTNICARCVFLVMPSVLAITSQSWEVALFGLAMSLEGYVFSIANALGNMFAPRVSRIFYAESKAEELQDLMTKVGRIQLYIVGLIFLMFLTQGDLFVECWMGSEYESLYPCVLLLIAPSVIELPQMIGVTAVEVLGYVKQRAIVYITVAATNILLALVLTPSFGALGACSSICAAYMARFALMNIIYRTKLQLKIRLFFRNVFSAWILPASLTTLIGLGLSSITFNGGWLELLVKVLVASCAYAVLVYAISFDSYEKDLLKSKMGRS